MACIIKDGSYREQAYLAIVLQLDRLQGINTTLDTYKERLLDHSFLGHHTKAVSFLRLLPEKHADGLNMHGIYAAAPISEANYGVKNIKRLIGFFHSNVDNWLVLVFSVCIPTIYILVIFMHANGQLSFLYDIPMLSKHEFWLFSSTMLLPALFASVGKIMIHLCRTQLTASVDAIFESTGSASGANDPISPR